MALGSLMLERKWLYGIVGVAALAVLATAGGLYLKASAHVDSAPAMVMPPSAPKESSPPAATAPAVPSMEVVTDRLAQRLKSKDGSADEWALLARSYLQMNRYTEAEDAFGKALQKSPGNQALIDELAAARKAAAGAAPPK
jgi:cytochrome c-type biogenesis protein CcmH/NrfG